MNPTYLLVSLLATSMYASVAAQRGGRQRDASHQMPPGGMQGPPPGMPQERDQRPFDMDRDLSAVRVASEMGEATRAAVSPFAGDASLVIRITTLMSNAFFDALAPYHPTAVGIYSNIRRQPPEQSLTYRNKNIAIFYCSLRVLANAIPPQEGRFVKMLMDVGLDPEDTHESEHDPIGIGNLCGRKINEFRDQDGMNSKGDIITGRQNTKYNHEPFADYTGYQPVNPCFERGPKSNVVDPRRWQPNMVNRAGIRTCQKFVTPQHSRTKAYSYDDVNEFVSPPHGRLLEGPEGYAKYKETTDEVLKISATLDDTKKMAAEFFDDKLLSIGYATFGVFETRNLTLDDFVFLEALTNIAAFDTTIAVWKEKYRWDAVRPFTAIPYLYGEQLLSTHARNFGVVHDLPASAWDSYMPVADHPEYPSLSASVCAAHAEVSRAFLGDDKTRLEPFLFIKGNSRREFGQTPSRNISLGFETWTDFELTCGRSRLYGGLHFLDAIEEGNRLGNKIGKIVVEFIKSHINPDPAAASIPLSAQILSTQGFNAGGAQGTFSSPRGQGQSGQGAQGFSGAQGQRGQAAQGFGGAQGQRGQAGQGFGGSQGQRGQAGFGGAQGQQGFGGNQQSFGQAQPTQNFASLSIGGNQLVGTPSSGFGRASQAQAQPSQPLRELPRRQPLAAAVPAVPAAPTGFLAGHPGFAAAAYQPFPTPHAFPATPVAGVTPHPGIAHGAIVPQTPNPYAQHYGYAATVGKK